MWLEPLARTLVMVASVGLAAGGPPGAAAMPQPLFARQTTFTIPFRIEGAQPSPQEPAEVQLYVSADRGATWHLYSRVDPKQGLFQFRAGGEGEYWFLIRTLDRTGQLRPQGSDRPGLRVVVDTTPPELQLQAGRAEGGQIVTRWRASDSNLNPESLKLQYRTTAIQPWQTVAVDRRPGGAGVPVRAGEASWLPPPGATRIEIRAETADLAGNPAVSHAQVDLGAQTNTPSPPRGRTVPPLEGNEMQGQNPGPVAIQINPALRSQYIPPSDQPGRTNPALPPGVRPRMVNTRSFELDYAVDTVGPSGIAKVEVWGTRDFGRTWTSYGVDQDKQSPLVATVNEEGIYGFCVTVQNGVGLGGGPPQSGQPADVWIGVDLTKPEVQILWAEQGSGEQAGRLLIRWEARDWLLAAHPISLSYSDNPGGPWTPIVAGIENTGQYNWTVDSRVPERICLRVEARDEAGNLGIYETPKPIVLDRLRPSVHIRDVRPIGQSARGMPERYYLR